MKKILSVLTIMSITSINTTLARGLDFNIGLSSSLGQLQVVDPQGDSQTDSLALLNVHAEFEVNRLNKIRVNYRIVDHAFSPSQSTQGMDVDGGQIQASWLKKYKWTRAFQPWLGIGISSNQLEISNRHRVDGGGFFDIDTVQDNREETDFGFILSATHDWEFNRQWFIDSSLSYEQPFGDTIKGFLFSLGVKYGF